MNKTLNYKNNNVFLIDGSYTDGQDITPKKLNKHCLDSAGGKPHNII